MIDIADSSTVIRLVLEIARLFTELSYAASLLA